VPGAVQIKFVSATGGSYARFRRALDRGNFIHAIARELGTRLPRLHVPYHALYAAGYAAERIAKVTRSRHQPS
jgi:hypothetical protein